MPHRIAGVAAVVILFGLPAWAQTPAMAPQYPLGASAVGGITAGHRGAGASVGGALSFDVTRRIAIEARALRSDRGSGERGLEITGSMRFGLARTAHVQPYIAVGGGIYRESFSLGDRRFFGMMNGQYAAGTPFVAISGTPGYPMMGGTSYGAMWQGPWTGATFTSSQMPMFYASRLGQMTVPVSGHWGMRAFTDPAVALGGGAVIDLTRRLYLAPDVRSLVVVSGGDHLTLMTMNVAFGVRF